jgi:hypothetical protein
MTNSHTNDLDRQLTRADGVSAQLARLEARRALAQIDIEENGGWLHLDYDGNEIQDWDDDETVNKNERVDVGAQELIVQKTN